MGNLETLEHLGLMVVTAAVVILLLRRTQTPSIVLYILAGLLLGPVLGWIPVAGMEAEAAHGPHASSALDIIAKLGIALLLFLVGLELSLERIRDVGKVAVVAGLGQVVFTALGGFLLAWVLGFSVMASVFLATALTFSSTVVVVKLLDQKKELHSLYGRIAVGIFLVQDLVVIVALTFLAGLGSVGDEGRTLHMGQVLWNLALAFGGMGLLLAAALVAARYLLPRPVTWAARSPQTVFLWALCWCFVFVVLAEKMGLSEEIGAFLAGLALAQIPGSHDLRRRVHPLMNFFIAVFFVSLGVQMDLSAATEQWRLALVFSLFVLIGNPFIFMWTIARCGYGERTSFLTSVTVAQISEFSFIFIAVGYTAGLVDRETLSMVAVVGLVTIATSSYMILYNHQLYRWCRRLGLLCMFRAGRHDEEQEAEQQPLADHVVVVGMNAMGRQLARQFHEQGQAVLAVDTDQGKLDDLPCRKLVGSIDLLPVVEEADLPRAKLVVSALQIEDTNNLLAYRCRQYGVPVAIHAFDDSVFNDLRSLGVDYLIDTTQQGAVQAAVRLYETVGTTGDAATQPGGAP